MMELNADGDGDKNDADGRRRRRRAVGRQTLSQICNHGPLGGYWQLDSDCLPAGLAHKSLIITITIIIIIILLLLLLAGRSSEAFISCLHHY